MRSLISSIAFAASNETGSAETISLVPSNIPATARIIEAAQPVPSAATVAAITETDKAARVAKQTAQANARKLSGAATGKPAKPVTAKAKPASAKPADKPSEPAKPATHEMRGTYAGASPTFRMHGRKLSPIVLDRIPGSFTERDAAFLLDLYRKHGNKPFSRFDADAGNVSRAIGHGYIKHVAGSLDSRTATFAVTERYNRERQQSAKAKPAKAKQA